MLVDVVANKLLWTALAGTISAQVLKVLLILALTRKWQPDRVLETGGMPSSHTASVFALATSCGIVYGYDSGLFAIAMVFGSIVTYDATGIRRAAGFQATLLNDLVEELRAVVREGFKPQPLKELLGHTYLEVLVGAIVGILTAVVSYYVFGPIPGQ
ncbi:MAG TPA: divergent PAP2 family protein [Deinococcales bacterium]|nr:divergent PAP2 family protein [Deinococcales bacterium]